MKKLNVHVLLMTLVVVSCAKEKEYKKIYKDSNVISKDLITTADKGGLSDPYIYVPTVENTPMNVTASRPFWSGEQKLVTFRFTEKTLEVLELPSEAQFSNNINNFSPVITLEIEHKDYRCEKNEYNECSNKEEEVDDKHWSKKRFFEADFTKIKIEEVNSLPEQLGNLGINCFTEQGKVVKKVDIQENSIDITIEKTLKASVYCADIESLDDLRNLTFKVSNHYSFVKKSQIASSTYKGILYPNTDQNTFGFFTTKTKTLTSDNRITEDSDKTFLNRWNPDRGEIVYNLSPEFFQPKHKRILDATRESIATINNSFKRAGTNLKIRLEDGTGKSVGDLRNSFIVLVPDPQASGVIGYGPSITNPENGEIIKGQVIMYYGTMVKFIQNTYDELIAHAKEAKALKKSEAATVASEILSSGKKIELEEKLARSLDQKANLLQTRTESVLTQSPSIHSRPLDITLGSIHDHGKELLDNKTKVAYNGISDLVKKIKATQADLQDTKDAEAKLEKQIELDSLYKEINSRECYYDQSHIGWSDAVLSGLDIDLKDADKLKPWNDLSEAEKQNFIDKILPSVWVSTLVHEVGHTLGLRHNFNGSEDKDNYYSKKEMASLGMKREATYSSIMDYAPSTLNELSILGKYDIAALRFAYARKVELKDGSLVSISKPLGDKDTPTSLIESLKEYRYCTDEHTSVNAGCNRHDEGTNLEEMARFYVTQYDKNFEKRNLRNKRLEFSGTTDLDYYQTQRYTFEGLRIFFENYDRVTGMYGEELKKDPTLWDTVPWLKDLKAATKVAGDFYLRILSTPSIHCVVLDAMTGELAGIIPIEKFLQETVSCFDVKLKPEYKMLGEMGRHLNNARSEKLRGDIKADPSQISIRGIWLDKFLAIQYLLKQEMNISTFDDYRTSFFDHDLFRSDIQKLLTGMVTGTIESYPEIRLADGSKVTIDDIVNRPIEERGLAIPFAIGKTLAVKRSFDYRLRSLFGKAEIDLREIVIPHAKARLRQSEDQMSSMGFMRNLSVFRVSPETVYSEDYAAQTEFTDKSGGTVARFAAFKNNKLAIAIIKEREEKLKDLQLREELLKLDPKKMKKVAIERIKGSSRSCKAPEVVPAPPTTEDGATTTVEPTPEPIPQNECVLWEIELDKLISILEGKYDFASDKEVNEDVLKILDIMNL